MKVAGIVAEYNPLHRGHLFHMLRTRQATGCDYIVVALSGNFVQRGSPAIRDKWERAAWALEAGADLVIEIPACYALQSAEGYATGAVALLHGLGIVTHLAFGSECADVAALGSLADVLLHEPPEFKRALRSGLDAGLPYARALQQAVAACLDVEAAKILELPNAILSIAYIKALRRLGASMQPCPLPRESASYHSLSMDATFPSATAIRRHLLHQGADELAEQALPPFVFHSLRDGLAESIPCVGWSYFDEALLYTLRRLGPEGIQSIPEVDEGLENRFYSAAQTARTAKELIMAVKNKRYPLTRLQRVCACALLGITRQRQQPFLPSGDLPLYIRILGMNTAAKPLLSAMRQRATLDIIQKPAHYHPVAPALRLSLSLDFLASDIYALSQSHPKLRRCARDATQPFVRK